MAEQMQQQEQLAKKCAEEKSRQPQIKAFTETAAKIKATLPDYDALSAKQALFEKNRKFIDGSTEQIAELENKSPDNSPI